MTPAKRLAGQTSFPLPAPPLPEPEPDGNHGEVFTRLWVVELILDLAGYDATLDLGSRRLVEPACGGGAFLRCVAQRLIRSCVIHRRPISDVTDCVLAFDLQLKNVHAAQAAVVDEFMTAGLTVDEARAIAEAWVQHEDFLLSAHTIESVDFVVGNPPYIRPEDVTPDRMAAYRQTCPTMTGRADVYVGFFEVGLSLLRDGGTLGFICADRWMRNAYGRKLRDLISTSYSVRASLEMHDVDAFAERVSAYPAVTMLEKSKQGPVLVTKATSSFGPAEARDLVEWYRANPDADAEIEFPSGTQTAQLDGWFSVGSPWPTGSPERLAVLRDLEARFQPLEMGTTRVGIGVATGADSVFITSDDSIVEKERLLPLALTRDTVSGEFSWSGHYLVNPWGPDGRLIKLGPYPRLAKYYERHLDQLAKRHVAGKRPDHWYRTIDPVHADLTSKPKLLLPDMKMTAHPVLDPGGYYPHHNLYYVISEDWDLEVLGGLLLSRVAQLFIESYAVRMRGGTLRFQAQYLRRIRVPDPASISDDVADGLRDAFRRRDVESATHQAMTAYNLGSLPD